MKRKLIFLLNLFLVLFFTSSLITPIVRADSKKIEVLDATFEVTNNLITQDLGYGVTHIKDKAQSSAGRLNDYASCGPKDTIVGQQINVLSVESSKTTRIVNWTYMTNDGWTKQTVKNLAKNFELYNPGWKVIAAVNGDFFDINGNNALPYQGNGVHVSNGEVYRPHGSASNVGFKNDGGAYPLVGGVPCQVGNLTLAIYDESGNIVKEFPVDKINETVSLNELGVWFTYNEMVINALGNRERTEVSVTVSSNNTYFVKSPIRCLPISKTEVYGKGTISLLTDDTTLRFGQFAIETSNEEIKSYLSDGKMIRVQQNLVGNFEDCDNVTGAGAQLIKDGVAVEEGGGLDRHPRTCVGIKEDGSIVLFTVDGRQFEKNMYGMSYAELSAALLNYGCVEAYNLDGGGSTTMIIRNEYGEFDVLNSPSDGNERNDSNALLVVVPDVSFSIDVVNDTSCDFTYTSSKDMTISNLKVSVNDVVKSISTDEKSFTIDGLEKETAYTLNYTFDINYKDETIQGLNGNIKFTTGKTVPQIINYYYTDKGDDYVFYFNIIDPQNTISQCYIKYDRSIATIYNLDETSFTLPKSRVKVAEFEFNIKYNIQSSPSKMVTIKLPISLDNSYHINYELDGGNNSDLNSNVYDESLLPSTLHDATKKGYTFVGWFDQKIGGNKITQITSNMNSLTTLYARFELKEFNIKYELDGGINNNANKTTYTINDGKISLLNPTKEGYTFSGWYLNNNLVEDIDSQICEDLVITAKWVKNQNQKGCNCKKNAELIVTLTTTLSLLGLLLRKKH